LIKSVVLKLFLNRAVYSVAMFSTDLRAIAGAVQHPHARNDEYRWRTAPWWVLRAQLTGIPFHEIPLKDVLGCEEP